MRAAVILTVVAMSMTAGLLPPSGPAAHAGADEVPDFSFVSMPDFLNADVADLSESAEHWQVGDPNSTTPAYEAQIGVVLDDVARQGATDVLVAGDMVEGRWGVDVERTGIFGPTNTYDQKVAAVRRAAAAYYPAWQQRYAVRGLRTYTAIGDHEIGDNPWGVRGDGPYARFKHRALQLFKNQWARRLNGSGSRFADHPPSGQASRTAYATYLHSEVLLVTVDMFRRTRTGVAVGPGASQTEWLRGTLATARANDVDWVVVQGHVPVLRPVRQTRSSRLSVPGGARSDFWQLLTRYGVDLYLAGEVHRTTARRNQRVTQISHGGLFYAGAARYLVGRVYGSRLEVETRALDGRVLGGEYLWQTMRREAPSRISYPSQSVRTGSMGLTKGGKVLYRTGVLKPWDG